MLPPPSLFYPLIYSLALCGTVHYIHSERPSGRSVGIAVRCLSARQRYLSPVQQITLLIPSSCISFFRKYNCGIFHDFALLVRVNAARLGSFCNSSYKQYTYYLWSRKIFLLAYASYYRDYDFCLLNILFPRMIKLFL